ncbi:MAG: FAD-dependent oxidoreductase [Smithellaceae bacterium]|nr:FAD-dependent oxidoreductase [Smithellaceae bacterium]
MKILILGAVAAGPKTACRARRLLPEAEITLIDQDNLISYGSCGIPYLISGDVASEVQLRSTSYHMVRDERFFLEAKGVITRTRTRATAIDRKNRIVETLHEETGETEQIPYDKLVLATGSTPFLLPIPGNDLAGVYTISSLHKAISIKDDLARGRVSRAVVIGGGAIGLEMAESLADMWQIPVTIVELMPQILPGLVTPVFAGMITRHLKEHGVEVFTGDSVREFVPDAASRVARVITGRRELEADLVIMAAGVRPRGELARDAGLLVSQNGAILVNQRMQTSDPDIYAAGDCVEVMHLVTGKRTMAPFGSVANRQGRVVADNLAGIPSTYNGWVGSFIIKVFDLAVGGVGISKETAEKEGFPALEAICAQSDRAHFFPDQAMMFLNMVTDRSSRRVLGLQGIGVMGDGLLARINAAAGLIERKARIEEFGNLEMAYAPPFSTAQDILNATANVAENLAAGRLKALNPLDFVDWMEGRLVKEDWVVLDLRHPKEAAPFLQAFPDRWLAMPYDRVRAEYQGLPADKTFILMCNAGTRSYEVQCFLDSVGMTRSLAPMGAANVLRRLGLAWWPAKG